MIRIAMTGGIACGKSLAAGYLAEHHGLPVCEADDLAHRLLGPGTACAAAVEARLGPGVMADGGGVDRPALGRHVFADAALRAWLEALLHPRVREAWTAWIARQAGPAAVVVVPLLYEAGYGEAWDAVICIGAPPGVQQARLRARGMDNEEAARRIDAQWMHNRKAEKADYVIWNDGPAARLHEQLDRVLASIRETTAWS